MAPMPRPRQISLEAAMLMVDGRVPRAVVAARDCLVAKNPECAGDNLKLALSPTAFNNLSNCFRQSLGPSARDDYGKITSDHDRRQWIAQYVLDPKRCSIDAYNSTVAFSDTRAVEDERWITLEQLKAPLFLNDELQAKAVVESGELESRPHEISALAQRGLRQYRYSSALLRRAAGVREEAGTKAKSELTEAEYSEVTNDVTKGFGVKATKRKAPRPKEPETVEAKKLKSATAARSVSLRKLKSLIDRASSDTTQTAADIEQLAQKYPAAMRERFSSAADAFKTIVDDVRATYTKDVTRAMDKSTGVASVHESASNIDKRLQELENQHKAYKLGVGADVRKLVG